MAPTATSTASAQPVQSTEKRGSNTPPPSYEKFAKDGVQFAAASRGQSMFKSFNPYYNPKAGDDPTGDDEYEYNDLKPAFPKDITQQPYEPIDDFIDRGTLAAPDKHRLFEAASKVEDINVHIGTELHGLQVNSLTPEQKDDLALLVAERGVVIIRDQNLTAEELVEFGTHFGAHQRPLHEHPSSGVPRRRGLDNVHVVWTDETMRPQDSAFSRTDIWHSDVTYELNPPGLTGLYNLRNPKNGGGDTLFTSLYGLYDAFSPELQKYLESLTALHSGIEQADGASKAGVHVRRPPVATAHPLVRTHPATGWKAVFANPAFVRAIVGVPKHESDGVLNMLYHMSIINSDLTLRVKWDKHTLVLWDNRIVNHSASYDHWTPSPNSRRHAIRVAATAERPSLRSLPGGKEGRSRQKDIWRSQGLDVDSLEKRLRNAALEQQGGFKD